MKRIRNEKGVALVMVLILAAIALAGMSGLIYMVTTGTVISGGGKRYATALEAGKSGSDIAVQLIGLRGESASQNGFINTLNAASALLNLSVTTPNTCVDGGGVYTGLATKLLTDTSSWSACDSALSIIPATTSSYDISYTLGNFTVYSKIVDTVEGNTGGDEGLLKTGVVNIGSEVTPMKIPFLYTMEIDAQNAANPAERAKLSVLYEY